jgi:hypothetical protein
MTMSRTRLLVFSLTMMPAVVSTVSADEGMWLLNQLPREKLEEKYGFSPSAAWVEHVQRSSVRFGRSGSASFVSPNGLVMTNHHVASDLIADLSDGQRDYIRDGFYAATLEKELKCPHVELAVLMKIEEVTDRVNASVSADMSPAAAQDARKAAMAKVEQEAKSRTGLEPEVVTLYQGARYDLYLYKKYTDVRLVMAPEQGIAFFGGDLDNFEYPRFDLDVAFVRAYENGRPAKTTDYLKWSPAGAKPNELVFISGHPGRTQRLNTVEHLCFLRDVHLPLILDCYNQREVALHQFRADSPENARIGNEDLLYVQNGRKAYGGILRGLLDEALLGRKIAAQQSLRRFIQADEERQAELGDAHGRLAEALKALPSFYSEYFLLENRRVQLCGLFDIAKKIVRGVEETSRPDGERYSEFRDANLPSFEAALFSEAPIYPELERFRLQDGLVRLGRALGGGHPIVRAALGGQDVGARANDLIAGTKLADIAYRRRLYEGGKAAVAESDDAMIALARALEPLARRLRDQYEEEFESVETDAYAKIARAQFEMYGESVYPDATFTLRLSLGTVLGYEEPDRSVPAMTTIRGLYERAEAKGHQPPFQLPTSWVRARDRLDLDVPMNFICTNDIIGGNSGSPIFNRGTEIVGIVFDGNIHGLVWDFQFDQQRARAVGVSSGAILEALGKVYRAEPLARELQSGAID